MIEVGKYLIQEDIPSIISELRDQLHTNDLDRFQKSLISGDNFITQCPMHGDGQERKPSFGILMRDKRNGERVSKEGTCHCFSCGYRASLPEMISNVFGYDDWGRYGQQWLVKNFLSVEIEGREEIEIDCTRGHSSTNSMDFKNYVTEEELDSYREYHPYMFQRGLNPKLVDMFDIGYDAKTQCITFPNRDENGNCLFIARRSVNTKYFNYPNNVDKPIYGLYEAKKYAPHASAVVICESMLDALSFWRTGVVALALNGLGSDTQLNRLNELSYREYILATDCDKRGLDARLRIKSFLKDKLISEIYFPSGKKDANDCTDEELKLCIEKKMFM